MQLPPLYGVARALGIKVSHRPSTGLVLGYFSPSDNSIRLSSEDAVVYFHELAHAVHHSFVDLKTVDLARREVVAELSACILCTLEGIKGYERQGYEYIGHYCQDKSPDSVLRFIFSVLNEVEHVVLYILTAADKLQQPDYPAQSA